MADIKVSTIRNAYSGHVATFDKAKSAGQFGGDIHATARMITLSTYNGQMADLDGKSVKVTDSNLDGLIMTESERLAVKIAAIVPDDVTVKINAALVALKAELTNLVVLIAKETDEETAAKVKLPDLPDTFSVSIGRGGGGGGGGNPVERDWSAGPFKKTRGKAKGYTLTIDAIGADGNPTDVTLRGPDEALIGTYTDGDLLSTVQATNALKKIVDLTGEIGVPRFWGVPEIVSEQEDENEG